VTTPCFGEIRDHFSYSYFFVSRHSGLGGEPSNRRQSAPLDLIIGPVYILGLAQSSFREPVNSPIRSEEGSHGGKRARTLPLSVPHPTAISV
jgi:hypothetical protein